MCCHFQRKVVGVCSGNPQLVVWLGGFGIWTAGSCRWDTIPSPPNQLPNHQFRGRERFFRWPGTGVRQAGVERGGLSAVCLSHRTRVPFERGQHVCGVKFVWTCSNLCLYPRCKLEIQRATGGRVLILPGGGGVGWSTTLDVNPEKDGKICCVVLCWVI